MTGGGVRSRLVKRVAVTFVTVGLLLLAFVAYQLWGTALYEHQAQNQLRNELAPKLHTPTTTAPTTTAPGSTSTAPRVLDRVAPTTPDPGVGTPIGLLTIPRLGMSGTAIVEGTDEHQLQQGPGHYLGTSLPGQAGNAAIAGHRTTYGAPFYDLNNLELGDPITIQTSQGIFNYAVTGSKVVDPSNVSVLAQSSSPILTLTTCNPRYSAATRLVVTAALKSSVPSASPSTTTTSPTGTTTTGPSATTTVPSLAGGAEGSGQGGGLSGGSTSGEVTQAGLWGALTLATAVLGLVAWRRGRRPWTWVVLGTGTPLVVAGLLVCFQHVSLALPQSF